MKSLDVLKEMFPGQVQLPLLAAGKACGLARQTVKNRCSEGTFPIRVSGEGARRFCHILDVAAYLDEKRGAPQQKRRGPRTKKERLEAAARGEK